MPQTHEIVRVLAHRSIVHHRIPRHGFLLARVLVASAGEKSDIVPGTKRRARALHNDHMDCVATIREIDGAVNFAGHLARDCVESFGSIERKPRDP